MLTKLVTSALTSFLSKLILEDYEDTYYKLYKDSLKLELSSDDKLITKKLCKSFIKDYKEYIPLNIGYVPSFIKYENVFFLKIHITTEKDDDIFFSFILHLNGNIDLIINNYNNITNPNNSITLNLDATTTPNHSTTLNLTRCSPPGAPRCIVKHQMLGSASSTCVSPFAISHA